VGTHFHPYLPLAENIIFGSIAAFTIGKMLTIWPPQSGPRGSTLYFKLMVTGVLLVFCTNLLGLTFVGMEHVLQVLLAISCAYGCAKALDGMEVPKWCIAAALIAPAVRYEDLALTVALCLAIAGQRRWKLAALTFAFSLLPLAAFSIFLVCHGLPWLPLSVLVKGDFVEHKTLLGRAVSMLGLNLRNTFLEPERLPIAVITLAFIQLAWSSKEWSRRAVFTGAALLGSAQMLIGKFGWNHRYEVYALAFLLLLFLRVLAERPPFYFGFFALGLVCCASTYFRAAVETPWAMHDYYFEQHQMHNFVTRYYSGNYAVNDLGLASYRKRPGSYVLDLFGLASVDASRHQSDRSAAWLQEAVPQHDVHLAMIYAFAFQIPASWTPEAKICIRHPLALPPDLQCVAFYSTGPQYNQTIQRNLEDFSRTLPEDTEIQFARSSGELSMWLPDRVLPSNVSSTPGP
jgi:hypothetical protein